MTERYEPASDVLKAIIADEVPLLGSAFAEANFQRLLAMTRDDERSNRDWATLLLAQLEVDTPELREALLSAAQDEDPVVRAEALCGLAQRDRALALPLVAEALSGECAHAPLLEAATLIADPLLVELLRPWTEPSENSFLDKLALEALDACQHGSPCGAPSTS